MGNARRLGSRRVPRVRWAPRCRAGRPGPTGAAARR